MFGLFRRIVRRTGFGRGIVLEDGGQVRVDLGVFRVLLGGFDDGADRAGGKAVGAIRTLVGIDDHEDLILVTSGMDAIDRANFHAIGIDLS